MNHRIKLNKSTGLLNGVTYIESPNHDSRPGAEQPSLVVIHGISLPPNQFGGQGVTELFTNQLNPEEHPYYKEIESLRVSAHLFIRRDGSIIQFVPFHKRAWHAGLSEFNGREKCNDFSIGIELEGADDIPYTAEQYNKLAEVVKALQETYSSITSQAVVGHCDIAPGRKTDPGESFDWQYLSELLHN
jgi:AmpD protein